MNDSGNAPAVQGPLDQEAHKILGFIVDKCRTATDEQHLRLGICWSDVQRWQAETVGDINRGQIYACLLFLVREGYLTEGIHAHGQKVIPGISSDYFWPTQKAFKSVDWARKPRWQKLLIEAWERQAVLAAVVSAIVAGIVGLLFKLFA